MSNIEKLPQVSESEPKLEPKRDIIAGAPVKAIIPQSFEDAYRIARAVVAADIVPKEMKSPEKCMVAIMHGLEIGLPPMQALQRIAIINGRPALWGDGALSLVRGSGLCEYVKEWIVGEGESMAAHCEVKRKGEKDPVCKIFSVADAKLAGLWNKKSSSGGPTPWITYPKRMLQMRARGFALRDAFTDVLGGMYLAEELQGLEHEMRDVTPANDSLPQLPPKIEVLETQPDTATVKPKGASPRSGPRTSKPYGKEADKPMTNDETDKFVDDMDTRINSAPTMEDLEDLYVEYDELHKERIFPPDRKRIEELFEQAREQMSE